MRSIFFRCSLLGLFALALAGCFGGGGNGARVFLVTGSASTGGPMQLLPGDVLRFDGGSLTWTVNGDFTCLGEIDLINLGAVVRIVVEGNAILSCDIILPPGGAPPAGGLAAESPAVTISSTLEIVVDGTIGITSGFSPFGEGGVHITDDATLLQTASGYDADATTDDPNCGDPINDPDCDLLMPPDETPAPPTGLPPMDAPTQACTAGTHTVTGTLNPPVGLGPLNQATGSGPITLAMWTQCDVEWDGVTVNPPVWDPRPTDSDDTSGGGGGPANSAGAGGRKGLTMNVRTNGQMKFRNVTTWNLMDGGDGQCASATGNPAVATGGAGAKSGNLKARAGGGFVFEGDASLVINPGEGGAGGCANAFGIDGIVGCPGTPGAVATATGGMGGANQKKLTIRGFNPTGRVSMGPLKGGDGGAATSFGGFGGDGQDGPTGCDGGAGGAASATGGDGGDVSYSYSGPPTAGAPSTIEGGSGGAAFSDSGYGGDGGDWPPFIGGNGGAGGDSTAIGGIMGVDTGTAGLLAKGGFAPAIASHGTADANQSGWGGDCGIWLGANGLGGSWTNTVGGAPAGGGDFPDGTRDCIPPIIPFIQPANNMTIATPMDSPVDTIVIRGDNLDPQNPTDSEDWASKQIPIEMVALQLCSVNPIALGGPPDTQLQWDVEVPIQLMGPPQDFGDQRCWDFGWIDPDPLTWTPFLFRFGIQPINPTGPPFDHELHLNFFSD